MSTDEEEREPLPRQLSEEFAAAQEEEDETTRSISLFSTPDKDESSEWGEWVPLFTSADCTYETSVIPTDSEDDPEIISSSSSSSFTWNTYPPSPVNVGAPVWRHLQEPWTWHYYDSEGQEELSSSEEELLSSDDSLAFLGDFSSDCSEVGYQNVFPNLFANQPTTPCQHVKEEKDDSPLIAAPDRWLDGLDDMNESDYEGLPHEECGDDSVFEDPDIIPPTPKRARHH